MLLKIFGALLMIFGLLMITYFPARIYQKSMMTSSGIWFGVVVFLIGIIILVFL